MSLKIPAAISPGDMEAIRALAGEAFLKEGESFLAGSLGIILEGRMELSRPTEFPERRVVMGILGPGRLVGETSFFGGMEFSLDTRAMEPSSILVIDQNAFDRLAEENPGVHMRLVMTALKALSIRLFKSYERLSSVF